jgi:DNA-binding NarL/FixJ family response regulator
MAASGSYKSSAFPVRFEWGGKNGRVEANFAGWRAVKKSFGDFKLRNLRCSDIRTPAFGCMASASSIRVALVEDDSVYRQCILNLLKQTPRFAISGTYPSGEDFWRAYHPGSLDVVLMDINLPGMSGVECTRRIRELDTHVAILMLSVREEKKQIIEALQSGASGYLTKHSRGTEIIRAILEVHAGGAPLCRQAARSVVESFHRAAPASVSPLPQPLTVREQQILRSLSAGFLYKEIASAMGLSYETVHSHIRNIYRKMGVRSRTQAVAAFLSWS